MPRRWWRRATASQMSVDAASMAVRRNPISRSQYRSETMKTPAAALISTEASRKNPEKLNIWIPTPPTTIPIAFPMPKTLV